MNTKFLDVVKDQTPRMDSEVELAHKLGPFERRFLLSPSLWRNKPTRVKLNWNEYKFTQGNLKNIPEERGVYMFVVCHKGSWIPSNNYIMYVGQTKRTLQTRYKEYLRDQKTSKKRKKIHEMLNLWKNDIFFICSKVSNSTDLMTLEGKLIECLIPPYCEGDIPVGEIKKAVKVLRGS